MKSSFQTILIIVFGAAFILAIMVFAGIIPLGTSSTTQTLQGNVVVWGVVPNNDMQQYVDIINGESRGYTVSYQQHAPDAFYQDLIVALANSRQPDVLLYNSEIFSQFKDKLYAIPYAAYSERAFRDANIDGTQILLGSEGILGLPLVVDPLVVYYNKDILSGMNFVTQPKTWSSFASTIPVFTKRTPSGAISQSALGFGTAGNVSHMRDIISALFLQTGNRIVSYDASLKRDQVEITNTAQAATDTAPIPAVEAVNFYTSFANPTSSLYTWNSSLPSSFDMFISGRSAFYVGRASELFRVQAQNPNLNFDVMELFQPEGATRAITFGSFLTVGMLKSSLNFPAAYDFASWLGSSTTIDSLSKTLSLPPVRRDLLLAQQEDPYVSVFFRAALSAFTWPDPNPVSTENIFRAMITNISSGKLSPESAINEAARDLQTSLQ